MQRQLPFLLILGLRLVLRALSAGIFLGTRLCLPRLVGSSAATSATAH